jgi:hypothetical protein
MKRAGDGMVSKHTERWTGLVWVLGLLSLLFILAILFALRTRACAILLAVVPKFGCRCRGISRPSHAYCLRIAVLACPSYPNVRTPIEAHVKQSVPPWCNVRC